MANRYWINAAGGNWNDSANWSDASGGAGGASVPGSGDVAYFDASGVGACTVNVSTGLGGLHLLAGYSGNFALGSNVITFDAGAAMVVAHSGTFTHTADTGKYVFTDGGSVDASGYTGGTTTANCGYFEFQAGTTTWKSFPSKYPQKQIVSAGATLQAIDGVSATYFAILNYGTVTNNSSSAIACNYFRMYGTATFSCVASALNCYDTAPVIESGATIVCSTMAFIHSPIVQGVTYNFNVSMVAPSWALPPARTVGNGTVVNGNLSFTQQHATTAWAITFAGALTVSGTVSFNVTGAANLTLTPPASGTFLSVSGSLAYNETGGSASWTAQTGAIEAIGTGDQTLGMANKAHPAIKIAKPTSGNVTLTNVNGSLGSVNMAGALWTSGTLGCTTDTKAIGGLFTAPATLTMSGASWDFGAGANFASCTSLTSATTTSIVFSGNGDLIGPSSGSLTFNGAMRIEDGVIVTLSAGGTMFFGAGSGEFSAVIAGTISVASGRVFNAYKLSIESTGTISGAGTCYVYPSTAGYGLLQQDGTISCTGFTIYGWVPAATVVGCTVASNTFAIRPSDNIAPDVEFSHTGLTAFQIFATTTGKTISGANGLKITTNASIAVNSLGSAITVDGVDIEMSGTQNQTITSAATTTWGDVTINKTSGKVTANDALTAASLIVQSGQFDPNGQTITVADLVVSGGTFVTDADAMNGSAFVVTGVLLLANCTLNATASWTINASGSYRKLKRCEIEYCNASAGTEILAYDSTDGLNNLNINFSPPVPAGGDGLSCGTTCDLNLSA